MAWTWIWTSDSCVNPICCGTVCLHVPRHHETQMWTGPSEESETVTEILSSLKDCNKT